ncbi:THUMP domain-containing protein 2 [Hyperolius riggenbachi]|uniref:THUMP domain-containing protein 2 n=1 Tax=Hyperolius riggenbachi TaxID=752182 RepID=UPI0035A2E663
MGREEAGARFFCTAGRGMERFVMAELASRVCAAEVESVPGKVFFSAKLDLNQIKCVKSAERVFLLLLNAPPISLAKHKGNLSGFLQTTIIGEPHVWQEALKLWQNLQKQLSEDDTPGHGRVQKRKLQDCPSECRSKMCKHDARAEESWSHDQSSTEAVVQDENLGKEDMNKDRHQMLSSETDETITFRVSCRCSGANTKKITAQEAGRIIGLSLSKLLGWKTDLRRPMLEVFVHLNDMYSVVGFPITREPLASRNYIQNTGLRSTTAWAMVSLAEIHMASCVLDPMCGVGTILVEAAKEWPHASYLGIDISDLQLKRAFGNVEKAGETDAVALLRGSALNLPVLSESVDVVISDVPFGKKFTCSKDMKELLPDLIREMERVLRVGGVMVLLLSQNLHYHLKKKCHFKSAETTRSPNNASDSSNPKEDEHTLPTEELLQENDCFKSLVHVESHSVSLGVTEAVIFKCKKT